jgi:hypothetical protein
MTEQTTPTYDDEISLLDILVTLAESWKLLVFGPLIVGVLAAGGGFLWLKNFESVAVVRMTEEDVALIHMAPVLDSLIERFGLLVEADGIVSNARQDLKKRLTFAVDKKYKLATITAKARTPDAAQALANSAIAALLKELQVKGKEKEFLEKRIAINSQAIATAEDAIESILHTLKRPAVNDQAQEWAIKNLAILNLDLVKFSQENEELRQKLEPKGAEVIVEEASLPRQKVLQKFFSIGAPVVVISFLILLMFVMIRKAWRISQSDSEISRKLERIQLAFGVKRGGA